MVFQTPVSLGLDPAGKKGQSSQPLKELKPFKADGSDIKY